MTNQLRHSSRFPHLSRELSIGRQGEIVAEYKGYGASETYVLVDGQAVMVDCSDRGTFDPVMARHVHENVRVLAAKFNKKRAA